MEDLPRALTVSNGGRPRIVPDASASQRSHSLERGRGSDAAVDSALTPGSEGPPTLPLGPPVRAVRPRGVIVFRPRTTVAVHAEDPILRAGVLSQLRPRPEVAVVPDDDLDRATVAVVVGDTIGPDLLRALGALRSRGHVRLVVVSTHVDDAALTAVLDVGVAGILRRADATADRLVLAIEAAAAGEGSLPPDLLGRLLDQVDRFQRAARGAAGTGTLADREVQVLRLVADGYDTSEIASRLCYSQRTVKSVLHDVTMRLHLRNRSHAVAYALRHGLL